VFEGGTARLELTNPGEPLETGVEFMVHPPGKKLTRMSLLSGGEKALSAISFIFSIFLLRPASFASWTRSMHRWTTPTSCASTT
jgi:chromosome segregation protein